MIELWKAILDFADARGEVDGQGNSGEFHDYANEATALRHYWKSLEELRFAFHKQTGFLPVFVDQRGVHLDGSGYLFSENEYDGHWTFEK